MGHASSEKNTHKHMRHAMFLQYYASTFENASCTMGSGGPLHGDKARPGCDADHSPPCSAEVMDE
jgi:hypothetical protein